MLVLGSPIYFSYPTGVYRAFLERLAFPVYSYRYEDGKPCVCRDKVIETANNSSRMRKPTFTDNVK